MVCILCGRGARAEDPFRGLRAGPVRLSPTFFSICSDFAAREFFRTFADLPKTPQTHRIGEGVYPCVDTRMHLRIYAERKGRKNLLRAWFALVQMPNDI
jgi:hypothetical protein